MNGPNDERQPRLGPSGQRSKLRRGKQEYKQPKSQERKKRPTQKNRSDRQLNRRGDRNTPKILPAKRQNAQQKEEGEPMAEIEEQLRKQREQQRQKQSEEKKGKAKRATNLIQKKPANVGNSPLPSYFPARHSNPESNHINCKLPQPKSNHHLSSRSEDQFSINKLRSLPLPSLSYLVETCPSFRRRNLLRMAWGGRCLFHNIHIASVPNPRQDAISFHDDFRDDLVCKSLLHPSCRTFDVATDTTNSQPLIATMTHTSNGNGITCHRRLLGNYDMAFLAASCHESLISVRQLVLKSASDVILTGCLSSSYSAVSGDKAHFRWIKFSHDSVAFVCEQALKQRKIPNDFTFCDDTIIFPPYRASGSGPTEITMLSLRDGGHMRLCTQRGISNSGLPISDIFCIEADSQMAFPRSRFALGHRNGQISIWDGETNRVCLSTRGSRHSGSIDRFGSTTSLTWILNGRQILARGSFGDCHLYDVRRMGKLSASPTNSNTNQKDTSLLCVLSAPSFCDNVRSKMALYCNGLATDPAETLAIAPLLTQSEDPCFGFWSLQSGQWVGQKHIVANDVSTHGSSAVKPPPFLELGKAITAAFTSNEEGSIICDSPNGSNRFGLWFKCGRSLQPTALRAGNIYHMCA